MLLTFLKFLNIRMIKVPLFLTAPGVVEVILCMISLVVLSYFCFFCHAVSIFSLVMLLLVTLNYYCSACLVRLLRAMCLVFVLIC